jgi:CheY-like chemotaxis protein
MKVLVVDNSRCIRDSLEAVLDAAGYAVATASGSQAVEQAARQRPDVIVIDAALPRSGQQVLDQVRQQAPAARVVLISWACNGPRARAEAEACRAGAYLCQPFDADELIEAIGEAA